MAVSGLALAAGLAVLTGVRITRRSGWRAILWGLGALIAAWVVGYAALVRGTDPALLVGAATVRPLVFGGWAGAAVALLGALRTPPRPGRPAARDDRPDQVIS